MRKIRKAVIPAAGLGTRFLPATKAQRKERERGTSGFSSGCRPDGGYLLCTAKRSIRLGTCDL